MITLKLTISQPPVELPPVTLSVFHGRAVPLGPAALSAKGASVPCFATLTVAGPATLAADLQFPDEQAAAAFHTALVELGDKAAVDIDGASLLLFPISD